MDDAVLVQCIQALQDGVCKLPDQWEAKPLEFILLYKLIKVHAQQLKCHTDVISEGKILQHMDHIHT